MSDEINEENTASIQDFAEKYKKLEKENARLREALEFYANSINWTPRGDGRTCIKPIDREVLAGCNYGGKRARKALLERGE